MPYKSEKINLPPEYDRRRKLTEEQKEEIRVKYATGFYSQRQLAREYNVSRRLITFCIDDAKREKCAEQFKERRKDGRYKPTKEEWAAITRDHRRYKNNLYRQGKISEETREEIQNEDT